MRLNRRKWIKTTKLTFNKGNSSREKRDGMEKTVSEKIAEYALSLTLEQVPPRVLAYGKLLLLDTLGVAMANLDQEHTQVVHRVVTEINGNQGCTLWGEKRKVSLENAVLYNASLIHGSRL